MPRVSVLTPVYNTNPAHLRECIDSILNQTFTDFEFLILNDSPDNTELDAVISEYSDRRIQYIKNEQNLGISKSRNKLLKMAHGEYVAIFDHDDISVPSRLEQEVQYLDTHPHVGVVSGLLQGFGNTDKLYTKPETDTEIKIMLMDGCPIAHTACMIRKSVLTQNNIEYEDFFSPAEDYRLFAQLMAFTHFYNIQDVLVKYRTHDCMTTINQRKKMAMAHKNIALELQNKYPAYTAELYKIIPKSGTQFRLRLFGFIPLIKIKHNWIQLFECIPIIKIKRR